MMVGVICRCVCVEAGQLGSRPAFWLAGREGENGKDMLYWFFFHLSKRQHSSTESSWNWPGKKPDTYFPTHQQTHSPWGREEEEEEETSSFHSPIHSDANSCNYSLHYPNPF